MTLSWTEADLFYTITDMSIKCLLAAVFIFATSLCSNLRDRDSTWLQEGDSPFMKTTDGKTAWF